MEQSLFGWNRKFSYKYGLQSPFRYHKSSNLLTTINLQHKPKIFIMNKLFAILLLAAVIAVSSAQYYAGYGGLGYASYGYGAAYPSYGYAASYPSYGGYYGGLSYYKK